MYAVVTCKDLLSYCISHMFHGRRRLYNSEQFLLIIKPGAFGPQFNKSSRNLHLSVQPIHNILYATIKPSFKASDGAKNVIRASQAWPDPCVYKGSGPQRILKLCHTYMALGGGHLPCRWSSWRFGCGKDITSQTANIFNILKPSYSKTLHVWKRLIVERFEELNVDVDINMHMSTMITTRRCFLT